MELELEQSQQGSSNEVSVSTEGVEELKRIIEPTVTLFRVFLTLCKQGDWFSFAKRRTSSPVYIDDNRSCMKHWKSGFFLINRRAVLDAIVWRRPDAAIDDPRHAAGSFNMADMRHLSAHVIKLRDIPDGVLVLSGLSRVRKSRVCDLILRGADGNVMGIHDFLSLLEWTGVEVQEEPHLDVRPTLQRLPFYYTPPAATGVVILDLTLGILPLVPLVPRLLLRLKLLRSEKPLLLVSLQAMFLRVLDSVGDPSSFCCCDPLFKEPGFLRDVSGDAIHTDFFPFFAGPYYATYPEDGVARNCEFTWEELDAPYRPTFGVLTKEAEGLWEKVATLIGLELQVSTLKKQVSRLNDKLASSDASFAKSKAKGKERKKKIKSLNKSLDNLHS
nr:hypothetical protein [Tanacetum cinerariifolium]